MKMKVFQRAVLRQRRAWEEARDQHKQRTEREKKKLRVLGQQLEDSARSLGEVFARVKGDPCRFCGRCCATAAYDSGYFKHEEREVLLEKGVSWEDHVVDQWPEDKQEPEARCIFLAHDGCNMPAEYRSSTCLGYVCRDKLGPRIAEQGLVEPYNRARKKLSRINEKLRRLRQVPYGTEVRNFGSG